MEDLKKYMALAAKNSFWILSGLVLLLSSIFFFLTKASLDDSITTRISTLNTTFNKIKDVDAKTGTHPNDHSHKEMDSRLSALMEDVDRAWEFQYKRQMDFLTWPNDAFFEPKTHEIFDSLRPFEKKVPFPLPDKPAAPLDAITRNDRTVYRNYIAPEFPALARRIGSSWKFKLDPTAMAATAGGSAPPMGAGGMGGGAMGGPSFGASASSQDTRDLVRWSEESQQALAMAVLPWFGRTEPPNIHEIYYAQEDIWILRGLMDIIAQTNAGANENFQAIVKEIEFIRTGPHATRDVGGLWQMGSAGAGGGAMYGGGGPPTGYSGGGAGGMPMGYGGVGGPKGGKGAEAAAAAAVVRVDPADGRYVDANLKPLSGAQLRSAMNLANATDAVNAVAKRVQVRLRLKVDERFGKLITECGNGRMMLEVLQVRYNTDPAADALTGAGGSTARPTFGGAGAPGVGGGGGLDSESSSMMGGNARGKEVASDEVSIEIYGLIYLFNPPSNLSSTNAAVTTPVAPAQTAAPQGAAAAPAAAPAAKAGEPPASGRAEMNEEDTPPSGNPTAPPAETTEPNAPAETTTPPPAPQGDGGGTEPPAAPGNAGDEDGGGG